MSPNTKTTSFRFSEALLARIDAYAERLSTEAGVPVSRAAAAAKLLALALDQLEGGAQHKPRKK